MKEFGLLCLVFILAFFFIPEGFRKPGKVPALERPDLPEDMPYRSKYILTNNEYRFYTALKPLADANSYLICPKVGLKDLFRVTAKGDDYQKHFARISQKHVDFLICDSTLHPLFAIELDDKSHKNKDVKSRDDFKNALFAAAGLTLYRVTASEYYSEEYILTFIPNLKPAQPFRGEIV